MNSSSTSGNPTETINHILKKIQQMIRDLITKSENVFFLKQFSISESFEFFIQNHPNLLYFRFPKNKVQLGNIKNFIKFQHPHYHQKQVINNDQETQNAYDDVYNINYFYFDPKNKVQLGNIENNDQETQNAYDDVYNINSFDIYFKLFQLNFTVPDTMIGKTEETEFLFHIIFFSKPVFLTIPHSIYEDFIHQLSEFYDVIDDDQNKQKLNPTTKSSNPHNSSNSYQNQKFTSHSNNRIKNNNETVKLKLRIFTVIKNEKTEIDPNNLILLNSNLSKVKDGIKYIKIPVKYEGFFVDLLKKYTLVKGDGNFNTYVLTPNNQKNSI